MRRYAAPLRVGLGSVAACMNTCVIFVETDITIHVPAWALCPYLCKELLMYTAAWTYDKLYLMRNFMYTSGGANLRTHM